MADGRCSLVYLVRLWSVHHDGDLVQRASAENALTGEYHAFAGQGSVNHIWRLSQ